VNTPSRRDELIVRCRRERNELIAVTARTLARLPHARDAARFFTFVRRVVRGALRNRGIP
jgi:hypothetical protein